MPESKEQEIIKKLNEDISYLNKLLENYRELICEQGSLETNIADLRFVVKKLEWSGRRGDEEICPDCGVPMYIEHKPYCDLNKALKKSGG